MNMHFKLLLCLALVLSGGLCGCSTTPRHSSADVSPGQPQKPAFLKTWQTALYTGTTNAANPMMIPFGSAGVMHYIVPAEVAQVLESQPTNELLPFLLELRTEPPPWKAGIIDTWIAIVRDGLHGTPTVITNVVMLPKGVPVSKAEIPAYCYNDYYLSGNLRSRMEQAANDELPKGEQQVKFAFIGDIRTQEGIYHVVDQSLILTGMLAPRGEPTRLLLFSDNARLVAAYQADIGQPFWRPLALWCEGSRVYLAGFNSLHFADSVSHEVPPDPRLARLFTGNDRTPTGNVVDFSCGPLKPFLTREKRYGSSGGLEDDPWKLQ